MNKLRRNPAAMRPSFPSVDKKTAHVAGTLAGNMMAYKSNPSPKTSHTPGASMPGNMMGYKDTGKSPMSYPPISDESKNYGNKRLPEPTRSGFTGKTVPKQLRDYVTIDPGNPEWVQIQSVPKKKGAFYG